MQHHAQHGLRKDFFARFFPTPSFLRMSSVGVDVSDKSIKYIQLKEVRGVCTLATYGDVDLEEGVVAGGEIQKEEGLVAGLQQVRARVETSFVRASLPEQKAYFFTTEVAANISHDQIIKILEFELEEHVPLSPAEAIIDYDRIVTKEEQEEENVSIGVTVYPRKTVNQYTNAFVQAGFFPLSFEIEAQAIERAVLPEGDRGTYMIIDLGETRTGVSIVHSDTLGFTSTLDVAGSNLSTIFMEELSISKDDVAHAKNTIGLVGGSRYEALGRRLEGALSMLGTEIKRHFDYWETHVKEDGGDKRSAIEEVVLCGGNANLKGLPGYLEQLLGVPVRRANVWANALSLDEETPPISFEQSLSYSTAVGLALRNDT